FPAGEDRLEKVLARLIKYGMVKEKSDAIMQRIRLAANWADDMMQEEKFEVQLSDVQRKAVLELIEAIGPFAGIEDTQDNAKSLQSKVFDIARDNGMEPKEFFTLLYSMF